MSDFALGLVLPQVFLLVFGVLALAVGLWASRDGWLWHSVTPAAMGAAGLVLAIIAQVPIVIEVLPKIRPLAVTQLSGALTVDAAGTVFGLLACMGTLIVLVMSLEHFRDDPRNQGEYCLLLLFACCAVTLAAYAADFISIYICIEFLSLASYALVGFAKFDERSNEAALKYYLFGGTCSAVMLYGMTLLFGITGTLNLQELGEKLMIGAYPSISVWVAVSLVLAGLGYKIAAVPFHLWAPDVYEGAPTPVTAFLSIVSKAAGLAVLLRFFWTAFAGGSEWTLLLAIASGVSMTLGNLAAIPQHNIKRMLAYSSIAQVGYMLIGFAALAAGTRDPSPIAVSGVLIYLTGYLFANLGAFAAVVAVGKLTGGDDIRNYRGLMRRAPVVAICMVIFFLSLAGIPPTLGFAGKFWLFASAIRSSSSVLWWLAVVGIANSVISIYYYFNVVREMFFVDAEDTSRLSPHVASMSAIGVCAVATVALLIALQPVGHLAAANAWMFFAPR